MTIAEFVSLASQVSLGPRMTLKAYEDMYGVTVTIGVHDVDAHDASRKVDVWHSRYLAETYLHGMTRERAIFWIRDRFLSTLKHEADEFFTVAGQRPFDPHRRDIQ